jgi:hypothetical protein
MTIPDYADRIRSVRAAIAEQGAKMPPVGADGHLGALFAAAGGEPGPATTEQDQAPVEPAGRPGGPKPDMSQGTRGAPPTLTYQQELQKAQASGRTIDYLSLLNKPLTEANRLGISVREWHTRYGH